MPVHAPRPPRAHEALLDAAQALLGVLGVQRGVALLASAPERRGGVERRVQGARSLLLAHLEQLQLDQEAPHALLGHTQSTHA